MLQKPLNLNGTGADALFLTAKGGHLEVVRLLLEAGADQNAGSQHGATALMTAAYRGHLEVVQWLIEAGSDKNAAAQGGETALMSATENWPIGSGVARGWS